MMLELEDVHLAFGTRNVLRGVTCTFETGKITGIIGDNGAGKTTLLRIATTILAPMRGDVRLDRAPLTHESVRQRTAIGALIENPGHYDELSVRDNLSFFFSFHCDHSGACHAVTSRTIQRFRLEEVQDQKVGTLSTGYRQRVAVARAFHPRAQVVVLDEPLAGLDPTARSHLKETLRSRAQHGVALCLSSHGLADLDALCDRLYVLTAGRLHEFAGFDQIRATVNLPGGADLDIVYAKLMEKLSGVGQ